MKIRNKQTGQIFEVLPGTLYAKNIFEEVTDDEIKVGEPTVEFEIEETPDESEKPVEKFIHRADVITEVEDPYKVEEPKPKKKTTKKGAKKDGKTKRN